MGASDPSADELLIRSDCRQAAAGGVVDGDAASGAAVAAQGDDRAAAIGTVVAARAEVEHAGCGCLGIEDFEAGSGVGAEGGTAADVDEASTVSDGALNGGSGRQIVARLSEGDVVKRQRLRRRISISPSESAGGDPTAHVVGKEVVDRFHGVVGDLAGPNAIAHRKRTGAPPGPGDRHGGSEIFGRAYRDEISLRCRKHWLAECNGTRLRKRRKSRCEETKNKNEGESVHKREEETGNAWHGDTMFKLGPSNYCLLMIDY